MVVRKIFRTISMLLVILFALSVILTGLFRNSIVQTYLARITAIHLSEYLNAKVKINNLRVSAYFNLEAKDVEVNDLQDEPLIRLKSLYISSDILKTFHSDLILNNVILDSAQVYLRRHKHQQQLNINRILNKLRRPQSSLSADTIEHAPFVLHVKNLELKDCRFVYQIADKTKDSGFGMDYYNLDVKSIQAKLKDILLVNDSISGKIESLSANEKSGISLKNLNTQVDIYNRGLVLKNARLETAYSHLNFDLKFDYPNWDAYNHFDDEVKMSGTIRKSKVNMKDIAFFAPAMEGMDNLFSITTTFSGPVKNLRLRKLQLKQGQGSYFSGNIQLTGLPNIYETFISLRIRDFSTSLKDIQAFKLPGGKVLTELPQTLSEFGTLKVKGNFTGFYNDFVSNAKFSTNIGLLTTDIQFSNDSKRNIIGYKGDFKARQFNLGQFLNEPDLFGKSDFDVQVKGEGLDIKSLNANVIGKINAFQFKQHQLKDIAINGLFQERQFTGDVSISDKLIKADFAGHIKFDTLLPVFNFKLKLKDTHLASLGLLPVDTSALVSSNIRLNFSGKTLDNIRGEIIFDSTFLNYKQEKYEMQSFNLKTKANDQNIRSIQLQSDFIDGEVNGLFLLSDIRNSANLFLKDYLPNQLSVIDIKPEQSTRMMNWDFRFKNFSRLLSLFDQSIQISEDASWDGHFDAGNNALKSQLHLKYAIVDGVKLKDLEFRVHSNKSALYANVDVSTMLFKESQKEDTLQLSIDNLRLLAQAKNDSIHFKLDWKNNFEAIQNRADIKAYLSLSQPNTKDFKFEQADLIINDTAWTIHPDNLFRIQKDALLFQKVGFSSKSQQIEITGALDQLNEQALKVNFKHFDISDFDILMHSKRIDLDGFIDGNIQFLNIFDNMDFLADMDITQFSINHELIGDAHISSKRNLDKSIFINAEIEKKLADAQLLKPLIFEGYYYPDRIFNSLDFSLFLKDLPIQVASPFLYKWVDHFKGTASGNVFVEGNLELPDVHGQVHLNKADFRIKYLNTTYQLTADALIDNSSISLHSADLRDEMNNRADVKGGLVHNHLRNFGVDLSINAHQFMGLNTRKGMNSLYYGKAFVSGNVDIKGPFDAVNFDVKLQADKGSGVVIPINLTADVSDNEFITFVNKKDTLHQTQIVPKIKELAGFSLNMDLALNPDANVEIILPEDLGNIQGVGFGDLNLNLNRAGNFTMAGDYQVNKGTFLFSVKNVYKKRFDIVDGGTISWTGDPYAGELNMKAVYHVKTSLKTLGATQDTSYRSRVPVDCVIGLKDKILNPEVDFGFEFPNSPETVRQQVFSLIDTTNQAEMSQQMLSLLVLNSFSFSSATGNADLASSVGGSSLQFVANQLGNWLSQISNDLDVGINYRPGGAITNEEVEVALSTQLFDDRVSIDGNFGYQNLNGVPNSNTSNIVGDINVEVKIAKDGRFRLKAFNRTNTLDADNTAPYTQGVGVFYRKEFNFFSELFKRKKARKKKKSKKSEAAEEKLIKQTAADENTLISSQEI